MKLLLESILETAFFKQQYFIDELPCPKCGKPCKVAEISMHRNGFFILKYFCSQCEMMHYVGFRIKVKLHVSSEKVGGMDS